MLGRISIFHSYNEYLTLLREVLVEEGFDVVTATTRAELASILQAHPQLVILDLHIDRWNNGLDLIQDIRSVSECANMPIVLSCVDLVALNNNTELLRQYDVVQMRRPWDMEELLAIIHANINKK